MNKEGKMAAYFFALTEARKCFHWCRKFSFKQLFLAKVLYILTHIWNELPGSLDNKQNDFKLINL